MATSEPDQKMEVDTTPVESTQPEEKTQPESVPQPETVQESPIEEPSTEEPAVEELPVDDEPPIEEDSLPIAVDEVENVTPSTAVEVSEVVESEGVSAAADTTTIVINDSEPVITSPPESNADKNEPIELQSSPSDIDPQENTVTNSQAVVAQPDAIVDLESSNSGDEVAIADDVNDSQALNSLELEAINSDSSLGVAEIQDDQPSSGGEAAAAAQESPLPTSTADITITADVASVTKTNDNSVHSSEHAQNAVESTNNQKPIEIPDNFRTTITGEEEKFACNFFQRNNCRLNIEINRKFLIFFPS